MVIEGILTTEADDGSMHVAPIGPHVDVDLREWTLKPFQSSQTYTLLRRRGRGVFHVVDDGLLMVDAVLGFCNPPHPSPNANWVPEWGWILENSVRAVPLAIQAWDLSAERAVAHCSPGPSIEGRPFWGWNRARNSLLELAILASRRHLLDRETLVAEWKRHRSIIEKTAGEREFQGLQRIESALALGDSDAIR